MGQLQIEPCKFGTEITLSDAGELCVDVPCCRKQRKRIRYNLAKHCPRVNELLMRLWREE